MDGGIVAPSDEQLMKSVHVFMVSFPGQGHVNPLLRLGKRLADFGCLITFSAPEAIGPSLRRSNNIVGDEPVPFGRGSIRFDFFYDGWDPDNPNRHDIGAYMAQLESAGREKLPEMIRNQSARGRPVSCLINSPFIPWVSDMAEDLGIPSAILWVQSCASFSAYYHFHHKLVPFPTENEPEIDVQLPCMPLLKHDEIPSFLHPNTPYPFLREAILAQFDTLHKPISILMDTFQELEHETVEYMSRISRPIKTIGPLFKSSDSKDAVKADMYEAENCIGWLDGKSPRTVVYISFGSIVHLKQEQIDEIAHGLIQSEVHFLWVMRPLQPQAAAEARPHVLPEGFLEAVAAGGERGKVVRWAPQEAVLGHRATGCFVTHCGWNSTVEALASGVPVVAFPQWGDQVTDAKYLVDVFRVGLRLCRGEAEGRVVGRDEVERCLRAATAGPEAEELRRNAGRWKRAAEEAVAEGGSSCKNMEALVREVAGIGGRN
ncbi:UDP-glycosyltransferase 84A1 [Striga hermonthica]|uniref:Glycosyltransferase n=1 Tax=Striga hermonthica TaxID=68872 RepID=A0A9N7MM60_STRHE|nr:UDP-glycosyltransferase 84A1 [Striga hermonthica]